MVYGQKSKGQLLKGSKNKEEKLSSVGNILCSGGGGGDSNGYVEIGQGKECYKNDRGK